MLIVMAKASNIHQLQQLAQNNHHFRPDMLLCCDRFVQGNILYVSEYAANAKV